jgi:hypothetical protein
MNAHFTQQISTIAPRGIDIRPKWSGGCSGAFLSTLGSDHLRLVPNH